MSLRVAILLSSGLACAQETVAPTPEMAGTPRGENVSGYNIVNSFETGYRFASAGGNYAQYQSSVNYRDGIRLLGSYFSMYSKDGHGHYFDELVITSEGLGNDPYEHAALRVAKNGLYRYEMTWRRNDYVNPGLTTGGGDSGHVLATQYDMQDHDFILFPDSKIKFFLGFTSTSQTGPGLSSLQLFDSRGSIYPLFENVSRKRFEYRAGNEFQLLGFRVNWLHGWEDFKDDSSDNLTNNGAPTALTPGGPLTAFTRAQPYHGTSPYWRVAIFRDRKNYSINGRFTYTAGSRAFVVDENATGPSRFGALQNQQVFSAGSAQRPVATGNFNATWLISSKLNITNSTSVYNVRTEGNAAFVQFDDATQAAATFNYQYLGIRTISNETDVNYQLRDWIGLSGGYQYSDRYISSTEQVTVFGNTGAAPYRVTNLLHAGTFALRLRPYRGLNVRLSAEVGRTNQPFTPAEGKNYHALNAKVQYKYKTLVLSGSAQSDYRFTPASLSAYSAESRTYSTNGSWTPNSWLGFDAGYSRLHVYSLGAIAYFENQQQVQGESSLYLSNINAVNIGVRIAFKKYADLYLGYNRIEDVGDGRSTAVGAGVASALPLFQAAQTFPMSFDSPLGRVSIRISEKLRWNFGYQYYGFREKFYGSQNFRANTGYMSVTWSF